MIDHGLRLRHGARPPAHPLAEVGPLPRHVRPRRRDPDVGGGHGLRRAARRRARRSSRRAAHGAYGYVSTPESFWESAIAWLRAPARLGRWIGAGWRRAPGVVPAAQPVRHAFTQPGDGVVVQTPVYYPVLPGGREERPPPACGTRSSPTAARYRMDLARPRAEDRRPDADADPVQPAQPGRARLDARRARGAGRDVRSSRTCVVLSDEIHMDLTLPAATRTCRWRRFRRRWPSGRSHAWRPSKTFNLAGLVMSLVVASNRDLLARYEAQFDAAGLEIASLFGTVALEVAYRERGRVARPAARVPGRRTWTSRSGSFGERIPALRFVRPEGTYLALIDCRGLGHAAEGAGRLLPADRRASTSTAARGSARNCDGVRAHQPGLPARDAGRGAGADRAGDQGTVNGGQFSVVSRQWPVAGRSRLTE